METAQWITRRRMRALGLWDSHLATPDDVVEQLTAMQAQEHRYALWSVAQRAVLCPGWAGLEAAFDEGRILRTHVLRPTWHFVAPENLRWLLDLTGPRVQAGNARRYRELGLDQRALARAADVVAETVTSGPHTRRELADRLEERGISAAGQRIAYIVMHAELTAVVCSGPMRGKQHTYAAFDERVASGNGPRGDDALAELARRYFTTRGPATVNDFVWWSGLTTAQARQSLDMTNADLSSRVIDGRTYWFSEHTSRRKDPRIDLVQCYDEVIISYRQSRDVLASTSVRFPAPRNLDGFTHVVLLDGRLLGHWRAVDDRKGLRVETRIDEELGDAQRVALAEAVERYRRFAEPR
jgi:hypothetical protein